MNSRNFLLLLSVVSLLTACTTVTPPPTVASFPTFTPTSPLPLITLAPSRTPAPFPTLTPTPLPTATPSCDVNKMLKALKPLVTYKEFDLTYNIILNTRALNIWLVEPKLDPAATGDALLKNAALAQTSAATVSAQLATKGDAACLNAAVQVINPIVVDRNYNGWFSGAIKLSDAATAAPPESKVGAFSVSYLRTKPTAPWAVAPAQTCSWPDARAKLQKHFAATRENVGFEFVIDETGINAYAQWDGPTDLTMVASLLNVTMELRCLYPPLDQLVVIVVGADGTIGLIGQTPGTAVRSPNYTADVQNQFKILYPQR